MRKNKVLRLEEIKKRLNEDIYTSEIGINELFYAIDVHTVIDKKLKLKGKNEDTTLDTFFYLVGSLPANELPEPYKSVKEKWEEIKENWEKYFTFDEEKQLWKADDKVKRFMKYVLDLFEEWTEEDEKKKKEEFEKSRRENLEFVADLGFGYKLGLKENSPNPQILTPEGKLVPVPASNKPFYLNTKGKAKTIEEAEKLVKGGKAKKYTAEELYRMAFPDENEFYKRFYGMSKKMKNWIDTFYKNKGIIARYTGWEERDKEVDEKYMKNATIIETFNNPFSPHPVEVYNLGDGKYALEYAVVYGDTFDIRTIIFKRKPTKQDFYDIISVEEVEIKIRFHGYAEEFNCWECGKHTHFVEICADSLQDKISYWDDKYCGCC